MRRIYFLTAVLLALGIASCKKPNLAGDDPTGEGLVNFNLRTPTSGTSLVLNAATPTNTISITWTESKPGLHTAPTYKWIAALKNGGSLDTPLLEIPSDNGGKATTLTITQKALDDALAAKNIAAGVTVDLVWSVNADNGSTVLRSQDAFNLKVTRFKDGASPFIILAPMSSTIPVAIDPGSTTQNFTFRWTKSNPAAGGPAVSYRVLFSTDGNFASPLFSIAANASPADTTATLTYKALNDSLNAHGLTDLSQPSHLKWTVVATSGTWKQQADYINELIVLREVRMYMPGGYQSATGNGTDWTPGNAPELIRDLRPGLANNMYYIYIYLPAGAQFKFTQGRAWDVNYGGTGGVLSPGGDNLSVPSAGYYRITINRTTLQYDIREARMGFVGGATAAGWNPPGVFPTHAMGIPANNLFVGIHNFGTGEWKLIDNDQWNNGSNAVNETRSYGTTSGSGSTLETNGPNFSPISTAGPYRVIWDGRNVNNVKYEMSPANEMRLVGDGINVPGVNDWDPGTSPQMTYMGSGKWQITVALRANRDIKFLAGNAWGAFDYEDNGDGGTGGGTIKRKIKWEGGDNFKTPAVAGTYTIILDEYTQTVTIQP